MAKMMFDALVEKTENTVMPDAADVTEPTAGHSEPKEQSSALAIGLPATWSIEPPAVVVRRKARAI
jgi:hypothetical protein